MRPVVLDYSRSPHWTQKWVRWPKVSAAFVALVCILGFGVIAYRAIPEEIRLEHEENRLLAANAPAVMYPSCNVQFTTDGKLLLPDGRFARLAELDLSDTVDQKRLAAEFATVMQKVGATKLGYSISGVDPSGMPVVHLWALSQNFRIVCGNSGHLARCVAAVAQHELCPDRSA